MHLTEEQPERPERSTPTEPEELSEIRDMLDIELPAWSAEEPARDIDDGSREGRLARIELKDAIESLIDPKFRVNIAGREFAEAVKESKNLEHDMLTVVGDVFKLLVRSVNNHIDRIVRNKPLRILWARICRRHDVLESLLKEIPFMVREAILVAPDGSIAVGVKRLTGDAKLSELLASGGNTREAAPTGRRAERNAAAKSFSKLAIVAASTKSAHHSVAYATGSRFALAASVQGIATKQFSARLRLAVQDIENYLKQASKATGRLTASNTRRIRRNLNEILDLSGVRLEAPFPWVQSFAFLAILGVAGLFALATYGSWKEARWEQLITEIESINGIDVASTSANTTPRLIAGFRDVLAEDPTHLIELNGFRSGEVELSLFPFRSPDPSIVLKRVRKLLNPPETVTLKLVQGTVYASGSAPHLWVNHCEQLRPYLLPQTQLDLSRIVDVTLLSCRSSAEKLLAHRFDFDPENRTVIIARESELESTTAMILDLQEAAEAAEAELEIRLVGRHIANEPVEIENLRIGRERAEYARDLVLAREPSIKTVTLRPLAERPLLETALNAHRRNHAVEFAVKLNGEDLLPGFTNQISDGDLPTTPTTIPMSN